MSGGASASTRWKLIQYHMEDWLCWFASASVSATPYVFLKRLEPSGLLFTQADIFYFIYSCGYTGKQGLTGDTGKQRLTSLILSSIVI